MGTFKINQDDRTDYVGRFAPSPTGDLHFGSLVAALGSYLQSRKNSGAWLVRIEDLDPPREVEGSAKQIISELGRLGLESDKPALFQSQRLGAYEASLSTLLQSGDAYYCGCSRKDLPADGNYPGTCRQGLKPGRTPRSIRVKTPSTEIQFIDHVQGRQSVNLEVAGGDFIIKRADGLFAYQLAVVVDDAFQHISEVVRGADLMDTTARQIHLQKLLGFKQPQYCHLPVVLDQNGNKLGKSTDADPLSQLPAIPSLNLALSFLGQKQVNASTVAEFLELATQQWRLESIPRKVDKPSF